MAGKNRFKKAELFGNIFSYVHLRQFCVMELSQNLVIEVITLKKIDGASVL